MKQLLTLLLTLALCAGQLCCAFGQPPASQAGPEAAENPCLLSYYDITATLALWEGCEVLALSGLDKPGLQDQWGDAPERLRQTAQAGGDCLAVKLPDGSIATVSLTRVPFSFSAATLPLAELTEEQVLDYFKNLFGLVAGAEPEPGEIELFDHPQTKWISLPIQQDPGSDQPAYGHLVGTMFCQTVLTIQASQPRPFTEGQREALEQLAASVVFAAPESGTRTFLLPDAGIEIELPVDYAVLTVYDNGITEQETELIPMMQETEFYLFALANNNQKIFFVIHFSTSDSYAHITFDKNSQFKEYATEAFHEDAFSDDEIGEYQHPQTIFIKAIWHHKDFYEGFELFENSPILRYMTIVSGRAISIEAVTSDAQCFPQAETVADAFVNSIHFIGQPELQPEKDIEAQINQPQSQSSDIKGLLGGTVYIIIFISALLSLVYFIWKKIKNKSNKIDPQ